MAADIGVVFVGAHHHRRRIPANQALDPAFECTVAGIRHLLMHGNGVQVGRCDAAGRATPKSAARSAAFQQIVRPGRARFVDYLIQRFQPFRGFLRIQVVLAFFFCFEHFIQGRFNF